MCAANDLGIVFVSAERHARVELIGRESLQQVHVQRHV